jgi:hypothetical protein
MRLRHGRRRATIAPEIYLPAGRYLLSVGEPTNPAITATVHTCP